MCRKIIFLVSFVLVMRLTVGVAQGGVAYPVSDAWWTYIYKGETAGAAAGAALDGTWDHDNGSDQWDGTAIGAGRPGGVSALIDGDTKYIRLQDTGDPRDHGMGDPGSNRKIFFTHELTQDGLNQAIADSILSDVGITISFRARISTTPPLDDRHPDGGGAVTPWPAGGDGYAIHNGGKGCFGIHQEAGGDQTIGFALVLAGDEEGEPKIAGRTGLVMNNLNGTTPTGAVDQQGNDAGTLNLLDIADPTVWHEFWITIEPDTSGGGTHKVTIWYDGDIENASVFHVTAGNGGDESHSYVSVGVGATQQSGAVDVDFYAYKEGIFNPADIGKASNPTPPDGSMYETASVLLRWAPGAFAVEHHVYFSTDYDAVNNETPEADKGTTTNEFFYVAALEAGNTYYWKINEVNDAHPDSPWVGDIWSFTLPPYEAWNPQPVDGARFIDPNADLSWTAGWGAYLHLVYFGTSFADVNSATGALPQGDTTYDPGPMQYETDYYWRVDEISATGTTKGFVWTFKTTRPGGGLLGSYYHWAGASPPLQPFQVFVDSRIDPEINFNWGNGSPWPGVVNADDFAIRWNGQVEAAFTETYTFYITSDDGQRLWVDGQPVIDMWIQQGMTEHSGTIDLTAGLHDIEMWMYEHQGGAGAELRWSSPRTPKQIIPSGALSPPVKASNPSPANGATGVKRTPILSWQPGMHAAQHQVYFGTDPAALPLVATKPLGQESHGPVGPLVLGQTYYWQVDEVNATHPDSPWIGSLWSFTVADYLIVDEFEDYNDFSDRIFYTWRGGYGYTGYCGNGTGAIIGHGTQPFAEPNIVHGGQQSMPYYYDNSKTGFNACGQPITWAYSEAGAATTGPNSLDVGIDWTVDNVKALSLWFYGDASNVVNPATDKLYVVLKDGFGREAVVNYDGDVADITQEQWHQWNIDMQDFVGISRNNVQMVSIGIGVRGSAVPTTSKGIIYFDDIRVYQPRCVPDRLKPVADFDSDCQVTYADLEVMVADWLKSDYVSDPLLLWYKFENNTNDSSTYGRHADPCSDPGGRVPGYVASMPGFGWALDVNGGGDYVEARDPADYLNGLEALTVCVWIKSDINDTDKGFIIFDEPDGTDHMDIRYDTVGAMSDRDDVIKCGIQTTEGWQEIESSEKVQTTDWQHVAIVWTSGERLQLYINGVLDDSFTNQTNKGGTLSGYTKVIVGKGCKEQDPNESWAGLIDDVRVYDKALTAAEIQSIMDGSLGTVTDHHPIISPANLIDPEPPGSQKINLMDYAILAEDWLKLFVWPAW